MKQQNMIKIPTPHGLLQKSSKPSIPIYILNPIEFNAWIAKQPSSVRNWLKSQNFKPKSGQHTFWPNAKGGIASVIVIADEIHQWVLAGLPLTLPIDIYHIENHKKFQPSQLEQLCLGWCLGSYQFTRYKSALRDPAALKIPAGIDLKTLSATCQSLYLIRDMVNTPAEHMGPEQIETIAKNIGKPHAAKVKTIVGDDLVKQNYPLIHAVGRAGPQKPRLIDLTWGNARHKKLTLVGKGVCFDTGGLDIKSSDGMLIMKKDMGGAAHALGLAHMIMAAKLPVRLRVLIPAVENSIDRNAFRPMDIIRSRKGLTVEIGNTDAEGRLILADCLSDACSENPDLLIDFATLTGAARVALGPELPAMFSNRHDLTMIASKHCGEQNDPIWPMPLWKSYRTMLESKIADINNVGGSSFAGAITAALFLEEFVDSKTPWLHFDLYAWNAADKPGRPQGGEAMTVRGIFSLLQQRYNHG